MILNTIVLLNIVIKLTSCTLIQEDMNNPSTIYMNDYCPTMKHCGEFTHVMCMFDSKQPIGPRCKDYISFDITPEMVDQILETVNEIRSRVANGQETGKDDQPLPRAYGMMKLEWDSKLATFAQILANQCLGGKSDECRATERFPKPSQSISIIQFQYPDWLSLTRNNSKPGFGPDKVKSAIDRYFKTSYDLKETVTSDMIMSCPSLTDHKDRRPKYYLHLIRGSATHIGCGISAYTKANSDGKKKFNRLEIICNLSDSPRQSQPVYMTEPPIPGTGFSETCGCPKGYRESSGCLCEEEVDEDIPPSIRPPDSQSDYQQKYENERASIRTPDAQSDYHQKYENERASSRSPDSQSDYQQKYENERAPKDPAHDYNQEYQNGRQELTPGYVSSPQRQESLPIRSIRPIAQQGREEQSKPYSEISHTILSRPQPLSGRVSGLQQRGGISRQKPQLLMKPQSALNQQMIQTTQLMRTRPQLRQNAQLYKNSNVQKNAFINSAQNLYCGDRNTGCDTDVLLLPFLSIPTLGLGRLSDLVNQKLPSYQRNKMRRRLETRYQNAIPNNVTDISDQELKDELEFHRTSRRDNLNPRFNNDNMNRVQEIKRIKPVRNRFVGDIINDVKELQTAENGLKIMNGIHNDDQLQISSKIMSMLDILEKEVSHASLKGAAKQEFDAKMRKIYKAGLITQENKEYLNRPQMNDGTNYPQDFKGSQKSGYINKIEGYKSGRDSMVIENINNEPVYDKQNIAPVGVYDRSYRKQDGRLGPNYNNDRNDIHNSKQEYIHNILNNLASRHKSNIENVNDVNRNIDDVYDNLVTNNENIGRQYDDRYESESIKNIPEARDQETLEKFYKNVGKPDFNINEDDETTVIYRRNNGKQNLDKTKKFLDSEALRKPPLSFFKKPVRREKIFDITNQQIPPNKERPVRPVLPN